MLCTVADRQVVEIVGEKSLFFFYPNHLCNKRKLMIRLIGQKQSSICDVSPERDIGQEYIYTHLY
jgi:hypothetical protein